MELIELAGADRAHCRRCIRAAQCLPSVLKRRDLNTLERLVTNVPMLNKGDQLFAAGQAADALYVLRSGALQSSTINGYGNEQIMAFLLAGDFVGVTALHEGVYMTTTMAMQTSSVCKIPFDAVAQLSASNPSLDRYLARLLGRELQACRQARLRLAAPRSKTRVARFISQLMSTLAGRGLSATHFRLPMARWQIANHLGLAIESLSRVLASFRAQGIVEVRNREVVVHDPVRLQQLADGLLFEGAPEGGEGSPVLRLVANAGRRV